MAKPPILDLGNGKIPEGWPPARRCLGMLLSLSLKDGATDLRMAVEGENSQMFYTVDGTAHELVPVPSHFAPILIAEALSASDPTGIVNSFAQKLARKGAGRGPDAPASREAAFWVKAGGGYARVWVRSLVQGPHAHLFVKFGERSASRPRVGSPAPTVIDIHAACWETSPGRRYLLMLILHAVWEGVTEIEIDNVVGQCGVRCVLEGSVHPLIFPSCFEYTDLAGLLMAIAKRATRCLLSSVLWRLAGGPDSWFVRSVDLDFPVEVEGRRIEASASIRPLDLGTHIVIKLPRVPPPAAAESAGPFAIELPHGGAVASAEWPLKLFYMNLLRALCEGASELDYDVDGEEAHATYRANSGIQELVAPSPGEIHDLMYELRTIAGPPHAHEGDEREGEQPQRRRPSMVSGFQAKYHFTIANVATEFHASVTPTPAGGRISLRFPESASLAADAAWYVGSDYVQNYLDDEGEGPPSTGESATGPDPDHGSDPSV
jgi:hypothetical protein